MPENKRRKAAREKDNRRRHAQAMVVHRELLATARARCGDLYRGRTEPFAFWGWYGVHRWLAMRWGLGAPLTAYPPMIEAGNLEWGR